MSRVGGTPASARLLLPVGMLALVGVVYGLPALDARRREVDAGVPAETDATAGD